MQNFLATSLSSRAAIVRKYYYSGEYKKIFFNTHHQSSSDVDQLNQILGVLGTPDDATLKRIGSERAQLYIRSLPKMKKVPWTQLYPKASATALDLLERLLTFDPAQRINVEEALSHPYLEAYHDIEDEVRKRK